MAFTVGINKNMGQMFEDLETLMLQEGWEKLSRNTIGSITTSRGYVYTGSGIAVEGKFTDTVGISLETSSHYFKHSLYAGQSSPSVTYYNDYPTEFSVSFWFKFGGFKLGGEGGKGFYSNFIYGPIDGTNKRKGVDLVLDKYSALGDWASFESVIYLMENYFIDKTGMSYEHFVISYSNLGKTRSLYINGVFVNSQTVPIAYELYTEYGVLFQIGGNYQHSCTFDELVIWNKVLTSEEVSTLYLRPNKVLENEPYIFEKYTQDVGILQGGIFKTSTTTGTPLIISIMYNTSFNIEVKTYTFISPNTKFNPDYYVTGVVGNEGTDRVLCGVSPKSTVLKKYWINASKDRVILAYKLYDPTALRTTPLYQLGYIGKIKSLGNDGASVLTAGTTNVATRLWTTISATDFGSGVMYGSNSSFRIGTSSYVTPTIGSINTTLNSLYSINQAAFMAGINISSGSNAFGSVDGVYVVANTQANPEDIITINEADYVILPNSDLGSGVYYLALKL